MTNTLLLSVINGPEGEESRSFGDNLSLSMRVALFCQGLCEWRMGRRNLHLRSTLSQ